SYGHAMGDDVLKAFTQTVTPFMRNSDLFGRVGGEEFVACIQNVKEEGALLLAQKICQAIEKATFVFNDITIHLTVSIGIAKLTNEKNIDELIEKSDKAMYQAKEAGRNQVCSYKEA
ncbi:MAG: GGDEF domain-containing protein, partial [Arcobacteraceae bacterium]|nr:GGDEF domain-containing protein [Arcobacteraceae bacterium]